jgi:cell division protein FtsQ
MKKKSSLKGQHVRKRSSKGNPKFWSGMRVVTVLSFKLLLLLIGMLSLSLFFLFLYQYMIESPYFRLEQVTVTGVDDRLKGELIELSGLNTDMSLLALNLNKIKENMERHPWIRTVGLEKSFPNHLIIKAEKEVPRALVALDKLAYLNGQGKIFKEVEGNDDKDFPIITGISKSDHDVDERLRLAIRMLDLFETQTGPLPLNDISEIHFSDEGEVLLYSVGMSAVIKMGNKDLDFKKGELVKIYKYLEETEQKNLVRSIDLNCGEGAVVSFKKG